MRKFSRGSRSLDTPFYDFFDLSTIIIIVGLILIFILWPITEVFIKSFFPDGSFSLEMYRVLFENNRQLIYNSIFVSTLSTLGTVFIATAIALYATFSNTKIKGLISGILMMTMISPPFVSSLSYIILFGRRGLITHRLLGLSISPYGWQGIVMMQIAGNVSIAALLIIGMMSSIDRNLINASLDLGESPSSTVRKVVLPLAKPGIVAAGFLTFVKCISDFGTPIIIGGRFNVLATEAYLSVIGRGNFPRASAISVLILIPSLFIFQIYRYHMESSQLLSASGTRLQNNDNFRFNMGKILTFFLGLITSLFLTFMVLQYIAIFLSAISDYRSGTLIFTTEYIRAVRFSLMPSFFRSIRYSFIAGIATSVIGLLLSYYIERRNLKIGKTIDFISTLPYIMPGPFFGIAYILAFNKNPIAITGTGLIVVLNCIFRQIPISTKAASAALKNISIELEYAARDLGSPNIKVILGIVMPLLKPAFMVSFVNTFTATMTTVGAIIFLITPSSRVATVEMFNVLRDGKYGLASVIASMLIFTTLIINLSFSSLVMGKSKISKEQ